MLWIRFFVIAIVVICNSTRSSAEKEYYKQRARAHSFDAIHQRAVKKKESSATETIVYTRNIKPNTKSFALVEANKILKRASWPQSKEVVTKYVTSSQVNSDQLKLGRGYEPTTPLYEAVAHDDCEFAKLLLEKGAFVGQGVGSGEQREEIIVYARSLKMAKLLNEYRCKDKTLQSLASIKPLLGGNILHDIVWKIDDPELVTFYVNHGLDVNALDNSGYTPLAALLTHVSVAKNERAVVKVMQSLVNSGALLEPSVIELSSDKKKSAKKNIVEYLSVLVKTYDKPAEKANGFEKNNFALYTLLLKTLNVAYSNRIKKAKQCVQSIAPELTQALAGSTFIPSDLILQYYDHQWENLLKS